MAADATTDAAPCERPSGTGNPSEAQPGKTSRIRDGRRSAANRRRHRGLPVGTPVSAGYPGTNIHGERRGQGATPRPCERERSGAGQTTAIGRQNRGYHPAGRRKRDDRTGREYRFAFGSLRYAEDGRSRTRERNNRVRPASIAAERNGGQNGRSETSRRSQPPVRHAGSPKTPSAPRMDRFGFRERFDILVGRFRKRSDLRRDSRRCSTETAVSPIRKGEFRNSAGATWITSSLFRWD